MAQPCPPWCGDEPGHPYTWGDDSGAGHCREHARWFGNDVVVSAYYEAAGKDGPELVREPPAVRLAIEQLEALTAAESRAIACSLAAAADGLEEILGDTSGGRP